MYQHTFCHYVAASRQRGDILLGTREKLGCTKSKYVTMNSSICHGCVQCHLLRQPNITPMCGSSKTAGKTVQSEYSWIWPGDQLETTVRWMLERIARDGGVSFPRTGETYSGFDVCKLCNFLVFRKPKKEETKKKQIEAKVQ